MRLRSRALPIEQMGKVRRLVAQATQRTENSQRMASPQAPKVLLLSPLSWTPGPWKPQTAGWGPSSKSGFPSSTPGTSQPAPPRNPYRAGGFRESHE